MCDPRRLLVDRAATDVTCNIIGTVIDTTGRWWKGESHEDLVEYLRGYTSDAYPATSFARATCACGGSVFRLRSDRNEGGVQRTCVTCKKKHLVCDSGEYWADASPRTVKCPCGAAEYDVVVGFSHRENGDVRWLTVGNRCVRCGVLASCADWKIDYSPTEHLLTSA